MAESNFVDYVKIYCRSGKGGAGSAHFRREKYIPRGGPDGGDGGRGGHVYLRGNRNYWTLLHLKFERHVVATSGRSGGAKRSTGRDGEDRIIEVPCGTVAFDADTGEYLCDVTEDGQQVMLLKGGRGGAGNTHFKTATNQAPRYAQPGEPAQERKVVLQLKLLADVGLVGFPNAGKSTLLSVVSAAKPKIADYPFTTLHPNLGVVRVDEGQSFVMADIPGLIEGAAEGAGLGHRFLKHLSRTGLLLHVVDLAPFDEAVSPAAEALAIINELKKYDDELFGKPRWLVLNKLDMLTPEEAAERKAEFLKAVGWNYPAPGEPGFDWQTPRLFEISALAQQGTQELVRQIGQYLAEKKQLAAAEASQQAYAAPQISETNDYSVLQPE